MFHSISLLWIHDLNILGYILTCVEKVVYSIEFFKVFLANSILTPRFFNDIIIH